MRFINRFMLTIGLLALLNLTACSSVGFRQGTAFNLGYTAPLGEPVYIEQVRIGKFYSIAPGILGINKDWQRVDALIVLAPPYPPFPSEIFVRWFNYKQQRFYEATVPLKEDTLRAYRDLPEPEFGRRLIVAGVLPDGQAVVWVANSKVAKFGKWVEVGRVQGRQVEGDVENYRPQIESMRKRGRL